MEEVTETVVAPPVKKRRLVTFKHNITNSICDIIGHHILLKDIDKFMVDFEKNQYASSLEKVRRMMPKLLDVVRKRRDDQKILLKKWENEFFLANEKEPSPSDIVTSNEASSAYELICNANECIQSASKFGR